MGMMPRADSPGFQNAPDIWGILRAVVGGNPWLVLLVALLSWAALFYGIYRTSGQANKALHQLASRSDRGGLVVRLVTALLLMLLPVGWVVIAVLWGNIFLVTAITLLNGTTNIYPYDLTFGSVCSVGYSILAGAAVTVEFAKKGLEGVGLAVKLGWVPAVATLLLMLLIRGSGGPLWVVVTGIAFALGFFLVPAIIVGCIRLCDLRQPQ